MPKPNVRFKVQETGQIIDINEITDEDKQKIILLDCRGTSYWGIRNNTMELIEDNRNGKDPTMKVIEHSPKKVPTKELNLPPWQRDPKYSDFEIDNKTDTALIYRSMLVRDLKNFLLCQDNKSLISPLSISTSPFCPDCGVWMGDDGERYECGHKLERSRSPFQDDNKVASSFEEESGEKVLYIELLEDPLNYLIVAEKNIYMLTFNSNMVTIKNTYFKDGNSYEGRFQLLDRLHYDLYFFLTDKKIYFFERRGLEFGQPAAQLKDHHLNYDKTIYTDEENREHQASKGYKKEFDLTKNDAILTDSEFFEEHGTFICDYFGISKELLEFKLKPIFKKFKHTLSIKTSKKHPFCDECDAFIGNKTECPKCKNE